MYSLYWIRKNDVWLVYVTAVVAVVVLEVLLLGFVVASATVAVHCTMVW